MPASIYASITPALTVMNLTSGLNLFDFHPVDSSPGFGVKVAVGKEWWVSDHWGLGLALEFQFASNRETSAGFTTTWNSFGGGFSFSATYN